ncbi:uroporphyrin-III C-methyltransferase [Cytophagales bacterium WSM2-2]|nr:uroporphyrin-III C-methyltransferase [Cytophagales bacterium WSM2-2]
MRSNQNKGRVILAGAGPGDPDLVTIKTLNYIKTADVLIVDRLVNHSLLSYAKLGASFFFAGKEGGNPYSFAQENINELLVSEALQGKQVLRLKGGDVSFFSNIFSELEVLVANGIRYEIVPGVTAASGAAACAGIPLTARGLSSAVRFLSYVHPELIDDCGMHELAMTEDTLVFYMSSRNLPFLIERFLKHERPNHKWVAVVEQATTPSQRVFAHRLDEFLQATQNVEFKTPAVIIVGKVAELHQRFDWFNSSHSPEDFFAPLQNSFNSGLKYA